MKNDKLSKKLSQHDRDRIQQTAYQKDCLSKYTTSSTSVKSRKSTNLISTLKRAIRRKPKNSDPALQNLHLGFEINSNSSLAVQSEDDRFDSELNSERFDKKSGIEIPIDSEDQKIELIENKVQKKYVVVGNVPKQFYHTMGVQADPIMNNIPAQGSNISNKFFPSNPKSEHLFTTPMIIRNVDNNGDSELTHSLQSAQDLANQLKESENNFIQILTKYVREPKLQQELIDIVSRHSKLQCQAESRTSTVVNQMWMQQIEVGRIQERALQDTLNSLVKQNRQLQCENEILFRKHEKAVKKLHTVQDFKSMQDLGIQPKCSCDKELDYALKHNEKLQQRLDIYCQQLEHYEQKFNLSQMHCDALNKQVRSSNEEIQLLKAKMDRTKTDYDLEVVSLNVKLQSTEQTLKETMEIGGGVIDDLNVIKRQLKNKPFSINWAKLKCRGNSSTDFMNLCRSYINELSKELLIISEKTTTHEGSMQTLEQVNATLKEKLDRTKSEMENLNKKVEENTQFTDVSVYENRIRSLQNECKSFQEEMNRNKLEYEEKLKLLNSSLGNYEKICNEISEKEKLLEEKTAIINNVYKENYSLHSEVESLQKLIKDIGGGDHVKAGRESLIKVQSEYYQLLRDKQSLLDKVTSVKDDNRILAENQQKHYQHSQKQKIDIQNLNKELAQLKQKLDMEHQTLLSLQKERKKYLEEKSALKTIFQHMKSEIERMQKLEGTVANISKEANRLAMIADFNKQIGDKLKDEVVQRENTICELRGNVEKLNSIQVENTKEKLSLCHELSEICNIKEQLSDVLSMEVQKNYALCETNKDLENTANYQVKQIQEKELTERETLKELFRELKKVVAERDHLLLLQERYIREIKDLQTNFVHVQKKLDVLIAKSNKKDMKILQLAENIKTNEEMFKKNEVKLNQDIIEYKNTISSLETTSNQLKGEKEELQNSIKYLQNNTQKLHYDLNEARKSEKEIKDALSKIQTNSKILEGENFQFKKHIHCLNLEKEKLMAEIEYVNNLCEKVLSDFETSIKANVDKEDSYKKEIDEYKSLLTKYEMEIELLRKDLKIARSEMMLHIQSSTKPYQERDNNENKKLIFDLQKENRKLQKDLQMIECKFKKYVDDVKKETEQHNIIQKTLQEALEEKTMENESLKLHIQDLLKNHMETNKSMNEEIVTLKKQLKELNDSLENEKNAQITLEMYNDVSSKYLSSTTELLNKKQSLQEVLRNLQETQDAMRSLQREKQDMKDQISKALNSLSKEKQKIEALTKEKLDIQRKWSEASSRCSQLETELKGSQASSQSDLEPPIVTNQLRNTENRALMLKKELENSYDMIINLKEELSTFQQQITNLEFQRSDLTLRLHESQGHYETEKAICEKLRQANQQILTTILQMKDEGKVGATEINDLLHNIQNEDLKIHQEEHNLTNVNKTS